MATVSAQRWRRARDEPARPTLGRRVLAHLDLRLRWRMRDLARPGVPDRTERARALLYMYLVAPILGLVTLLVPRSGDFGTWPVLSIIAVGMAICAVIWVFFDELGEPMYPLLTAFATVCITLANLVSRSDASPYDSFFFWPLLYAAVFFTPRHVAAQVALTVVGQSISSAYADDSADAAVMWVANSTAMVVVGIVVASASARIRSLVYALHARAATDPLTGLENRRAFDRAMEESLHASRKTDVPVGLLMVDIDFFKQVNDRHGHAEGDRVLQWVADMLRNHVRHTDRVFRIGGEEFAVLLPETSVEAAQLVGEYLRSTIDDNRGCGRLITVSVGVAAAPPGRPERDALTRAADHALYEAKRRGRNLVVTSGEAAPG